MSVEYFIGGDDDDILSDDIHDIYGGLVSGGFEGFLAQLHSLGGGVSINGDNEEDEDSNKDHSSGEEDSSDEEKGSAGTTKQNDRKSTPKPHIKPIIPEELVTNDPDTEEISSEFLSMEDEHMSDKTKLVINEPPVGDNDLDDEADSSSSSDSDSDSSSSSSESDSDKDTKEGGGKEELSIKQLKDKKAADDQSADGELKIGIEDEEADNDDNIVLGIEDEDTTVEPINVEEDEDTTVEPINATTDVNPTTEEPTTIEPTTDEPEIHVGIESDDELDKTTVDSTDKSANDSTSDATDKTTVDATDKSTNESTVDSTDKTTSDSTINHPKHEPRADNLEENASAKPIKKSKKKLGGRNHSKGPEWSRALVEYLDQM